MKSIVVGTVAFLAFMPVASAQLYGTGSNSQDHYVQGHSNSNGSYTGGHYQTNPNSTQTDNYGTSGNYNSHTGQYGHRGARY